MELDPRAATAVTAIHPRHARFAAALLGAALSGFGGLGLAPASAQSALLESVKQNPQRAKALCNELKGLNAQGLSYTSPQAVAQIAARQGLSPTDAEILSTYVVGLYCPDVR
jgi:hypothetical protein